MENLYLPWSVDADPAINGSEGHIVISDYMGNVAALIPFDPGCDPDEDMTEAAVRLRADQVCYAINRG